MLGIGRNSFSTRYPSKKNTDIVEQLKRCNDEDDELVRKLIQAVSAGFMLAVHPVDAVAQ